MEGGFLPEPAASPLGSWPPQAPAGEQASTSTSQQQQQQQQQQRQASFPLPAAAGPLDAAHLEEHPEALGGCSRCPSLSFNSEWHRAFGVVLCNQCRRQEVLVSKSTARDRYSLTDGDLRGLGSLRKANPHKREWQPMQLFMESQVARLAHDKHGGAAGLEHYQQAKLDVRMQAKLRRREEEKRREQQEGQRLQRIRQRIGAAAGQEVEVQRAQAAAVVPSDSDVEEI